MADKKITQLPASTVPLAGTEVLPIVQGTTPTTKQVSVANLTAGRAISAAELTLTTGNLVIGTSGKGIDFSATPGTGTSELLADYEEGTFTPVYTPATGAYGSITPANQGKYTKIGNVVYFWISARTTGTTDIGTASGILYLTGLPFTSSTFGGDGTVSRFQKLNLGVATVNLGCVVDVSNTQIYLTKNNSNSAIGYVQATELSTNTGNFENLFYIFGSYTV